MKALILAGGKGEGLLPLTCNHPKLMVPIGNIPFVFYQLDAIKRAGIKEVIICLTYQPRRLRELLGDGANFGLVVHYTNEPEPLGTAGAIKNAESMIDETCLVLNGDILPAINMRKVLEKHFQKKSLATIVTSPVEDPEEYGIIRQNRQHMVTRFTEKPGDAVEQRGRVNVGLYVFNREILDFIPSGRHFSIEQDLFPQLITHRHRLYAYNTREYWLHLEDPGRYLQANFDVMAERIRIPRFYGLYQKANRDYPDGCRVDQKSFVDPSCLIKSGVMIENSVIGANCRIEQDAHIRDSVLLPGTRLKRNSLLRYSIAGKNCVIGQYARITRGTILGDKTVIADHSKL